MRIVFSKHAEEKLRERNLSRYLIVQTIRTPDLVKPGHNAREERYKRFRKNWLKVIVIKEHKTMLIITAHWVAKATEH